jgi:hypothetical protein
MIADVGYLRYITDLDSSCALALAATVSPRQVEFLRDFMYKHLACRALIGVEIPVSLFRYVMRDLLNSF